MERDRTGSGVSGSLEVLRAVPEGVAHVAPDGAVRFLNPAGEAILGLAPGAWQGRNLLELAQIHGGPGRTHALDLAVVFDHLATGRAWKRESAWIHRTVDGRSLPAAYSFAPLESAGRSRGAVLLFRDMTDRFRAERAMQEARVGLAAATGVEAAKTALFASVGRDVLAPVEALVAAAERLAASDLPRELAAEAEMVRGSARTVVGVLNDLLDWARLETGVLALQPIEFDLRVALDEVVEAARPSAAAKGVAIELQVDTDGAGRVVADPGRLRQVTERFVAHAIRMTNAGRVAVRLETSWRARADATLKLIVEHGGPSVVDTATPRPGATPVAPTDARTGLALACRLVERMSGMVGGESGPDGRSASWFEIRVPLARPRSRDLRGADLRGVRALVVESSDTGRDRLVEQLGSVGLRCTATGSGGQALRLLRSAVEEWDPYRIAVLSAPLREMDAATLGDLVKGDPRLRDTVLVYLASVGEPGDAQRLESIGFASYLVKPVDFDVLRLALSVVWGAALVHADVPLVTRHALRDSRVVKLTPDEVRDRMARPVRPEEAEPAASARTRDAL